MARPTRLHNVAINPPALLVTPDVEDQNKNEWNAYNEYSFYLDQNQMCNGIYGLNAYTFTDYQYDWFACCYFSANLVQKTCRQDLCR
jgi:hypothetical protein